MFITIIIFLNMSLWDYWCRVQWNILRLVFPKYFLCFQKLYRLKEFFCEGILPLLNGISVLYWLSLCDPLLGCTGCLGSSILVITRRPVGALDEACYSLKYELPLLWRMFIARQASKIQASIVVLVFMLPF